MRLAAVVRPAPDPARAAAPPRAPRRSVPPTEARAQERGWGPGRASPAVACPVACNARLAVALRPVAHSTDASPPAWKRVGYAFAENGP